MPTGILRMCLDLEEVDDLLDPLAVLDLLAQRRARAQSICQKKPRCIFSVRPVMMLSSALMPLNSATFWKVRAMPPRGRVVRPHRARASRP